MYECPPFDGYGPEEDVDSYPKDDIQKYPYRVSKERRNAIFQKKGKNLLRVTSPQHNNRIKLPASYIDLLRIS